ncbi:MAG TPA: FecR domain-containing protein [Niastella sp.]
MPQERFQYLFQQYFNKQATPAEEKELFEWALTPNNENAVQELLQQYWQLSEADEDLAPEKAEAMFEGIIRPVKTAPVRRLVWRNIAIAASILLVLGWGSYLLFFNKKENEVARVANEVNAPETNRAVILLANGQKIYLDSAGNGQLASQSAVKLMKLANGKIVYTTTQGTSGGAEQYNTLMNPRGSRIIDMQLSDGTHIWLNSGSSVTYPVVFAGNERRVTITGEAYFEVAKMYLKSGNRMPFKVLVSGGAEIEVLGTHFNVNAYENEETVNTTLLEGSVKVSQSAIGNRQSAKNTERAVVLKPGEQAALSRDYSPLTIHHSPDLNQVMAWKNGLFNFNGMKLQEVMRQLERWYDIEVEYEKGVPNITFGGKITKNVPLKGLLIGLEKSEVHFRLEGRKLIVLP